MNQKILSILELFSHEKSLPCEKIFEILESALSEVTKKKYDEDIDVKVIINRTSGDFNTFRRWIIVNKVINPSKEITLEDARCKNKSAKLNEYIQDQIESINFDRETTRFAKRIIISKVREEERLMIMNRFYNKKGCIIKGIVKKINVDNIILNVDNNVEAIMTQTDMLPRENFNIGDCIQGILYSIRSHDQGVKLFISRSKPDLLAELFRLEVPEIYDKTVVIKAIAREPGLRSKVAVMTNNHHIDPIGACIGIRCSRIQSVSESIGGEKIDLVLWNSDPVQFVKYAMSPVNVLSIIMHHQRRSMDVAVKSSNLAKAIGKNGQNVRLASKLSGWELNIMTISDLHQKNKNEIFKIRTLFYKCLKLDDKILNILIQSGFYSLKKLIYTSYDELLQIDGISHDVAHTIRKRSEEFLSYFLKNRKVYLRTSI